MMRLMTVGVCAALAGGCATNAMMEAAERDAVDRSKTLVPAPPWPAGDERGMANAIGAGTFMRCAHFLAQPNARAYELSHVRSNTMPMSPFSGPYAYKFNPTAVLPGTVHAFNTETVSGEPQAQGTQIDALGHFAYLKQPWDGKSPNPAAGALYYGGYTQKDVKPTPDAFLHRLGMEKAPPLVTSAVLLDAKSRLGKGRALAAGALVTAKDIEAMLKAQGSSGAASCPATCCTCTPGGATPGATPIPRRSTTPRRPGFRTTRRDTWPRSASSRSGSTRRSSTR